MSHEKFFPTLLLCWGVAASHLATAQVISSQASASERPADDNLKETHCGTPDITEDFLNANPDIRDRRLAIEKQTRHYIDSVSQSPQVAHKDPKGQPAPMLIVPVVVHVIYNDPSQNLSDDVIRSQIEELNRGFRNLIATTSQVPAPFRPFMSDVRVNFCLATRDPNGQLTTGIT